MNRRNTVPVPGPQAYPPGSKALFGPKPNLCEALGARRTLIPKLESNAKRAARAHGAAVIGRSAIVP